MTVGRGFAFVLSVVAVSGVIYYIWGQAVKPEPLRELPEPIVRIRRPM